MTDSQSLNDATAEKRSFHAAEEGKLPVFAAGVSGNDEQLHAPPRVESPTMMMETTGGGAVPSFIRENDAQSILRQRAAAVGNNGGGLRSSSVPNLVGGRNQSLPHGTVVPGIQRKQTTLKAALLDNLEPKVPVGQAPGWRSSAMAVVKYSYLNVLLIFIPVSWAMHFSGQQPTIVFVMSFLAIVPLAALLGMATEEIALRVGDTLGGLINATLGNTVELLVSILALVKGELGIVRSSMLGSILSNCLLVLGMCYFAGGLRFHEQGYETRAAQLNINLLGISVTAIVIPVAFHVFMEQRLESLATTDNSVLHMSRGLAFILLFVYISFLYYQMVTHAYLYMPQERGPNDPPPPPNDLPYIEGPQPPTEGGVFRIPSLPSAWGGSSSTSSASSSSASTLSVDEHTPKLSMRASFLLLVTVTVLTGFTAEWLVSSIDGMTEGGGISKEFVAVILLPLVGNAAEHVTAVTVAAKGKLNLSMAVAVGSSIQIALFVIPVLILLAWCIGQPLDFYFDPFETVVLFVSIVGVNWAIADGRTNWLEGLTLMVLYIMIALIFWYYPGLE